MATRIRNELEALDRADPSAGFRDEFFLPDGMIYLNGNSLGAMPLAAVERSRRVVEQEWAAGLIGRVSDEGVSFLPPLW